MLDFERELRHVFVSVEDAAALACWRKSITVRGGFLIEEGVCDEAGARRAGCGYASQ